MKILHLQREAANLPHMLVWLHTRLCRKKRTSCFTFLKLSKWFYMFHKLWCLQESYAGEIATPYIIKSNQPPHVSFPLRSFCFPSQIKLFTPLSVTPFYIMSAVITANSKCHCTDFSTRQMYSHFVPALEVESKRENIYFYTEYTSPKILVKWMNVSGMNVWRNCLPPVGLCTKHYSYLMAWMECCAFACQLRSM